MKGHLIIDLATLPDEGKEFSGELPADIYDLPEDDAQPVGPLSYDLRIQRFESELLLTGTLSSPFEFTCVRTLHPFVQTITVAPAAISIEIGKHAQIDATEALREEILIQFPADPVCDDADEPQHCEIDPKYLHLSVDKPTPGELPTPPRDAIADRWSALDQLKPHTDNN